MKARSISREARQREIRAAKTGNARDAIGTLQKGMELYILTYGQFSLVNALIAIIEQTGPADVIVSTWTAGIRDIEEAAWLVGDNQARSLRFLVDRSFVKRQPGYARSMRQRFGPDCIRSCHTHAKFLVVHNAEWSISVRTSMNLNANPRLEHMDLSDDPALCRFLIQVTDDIYRENAEGEMYDDQLPLLASIGPAHQTAAAPARSSIRMGAVSTGPRT
jgi:hypothetical protein